MADLMPPKEISGDGKEVWEWADRLSDHTQKLHRMREIRKAIHEANNTCGSCNMWMTSACPREKSTMRGYNVGPSCKSTKCSQFQMKSWDANRVEELKAELSALED